MEVSTQKRRLVSAFEGECVLHGRPSAKRAEQGGRDLRGVRASLPDKDCSVGTNNESKKKGPETVCTRDARAQREMHVHNWNPGRAAMLKSMTFRCILAVACAISMSAPAVADTSSEGSSSSSSPNALQEVVVTAEKREEHLLDVPIPVSVVDTSSLTVNSSSGAFHIRNVRHIDRHAQQCQCQGLALRVAP